MAIATLFWDGSTSFAQGATPTVTVEPTWSPTPCDSILLTVEGLVFDAGRGENFPLQSVHVQFLFDDSPEFTPPLFGSGKNTSTEGRFKISGGEEECYWARMKAELDGYEKYQRDLGRVIELVQNPEFYKIPLIPLPTPTPSPKPSPVRQILECAQGLISDSELDGNCLTERVDFFTGIATGCLEGGLPDVGSPEVCAEAYVSSMSTNVWTTTWRIGEFSFEGSVESYGFGYDLEYNPARSLAVAVHEAGVKLGFLSPCEVDPFDQVLEIMARDWITDRTGKDCLFVGGTLSGTGDGCFTRDLPEIGFSENCPNPIHCEASGEFPEVHRSCDWRAGTLAFDSSSTEETGSAYIAPSLAYQSYALAVEYGLIPECPPTPTRTITPTQTITETPTVTATLSPTPTFDFCSCFDSTFVQGIVYDGSVGESAPVDGARVEVVTSFGSGGGCPSTSRHVFTRGDGTYALTSGCTHGPGDSVDFSVTADGYQGFRRSLGIQMSPNFANPLNVPLLPLPTPTLVPGAADLNGDGDMTGLDLFIFQEQWRWVSGP